MVFLADPEAKPVLAPDFEATRFWVAVARRIWPEPERLDKTCFDPVPEN